MRFLQRPGTEVGSRVVRRRWWPTRDIAIRIVAFNSDIAALDDQLHELVTIADTADLGSARSGTEHAAQLLITTSGNPERPRSEAAFAAP